MSRQNLLCLLFALLAFMSVALASATTPEGPMPAPAPAKKKGDDFPLIWVCVGLTVPGVIAVLVVAYRRPKKLLMPGRTEMVARESEGMYPTKPQMATDTAIVEVNN